MKVELPFLAEGIEGGDVVQVLVREGDRVTDGQPLVELETEKATVPVPTPTAGTVTRLLVRRGDHVKVGQALVELEGGDVAAPPPTQPVSERSAVAPATTLPTVEATQAQFQRQRDEERAATKSNKQPAPAQDRSESGGALIAASPSVRRLARELGVNLAQVTGTEAGGRITAEDVKAYVRERTRRAGSPGDEERGGRTGTALTTMYGTERREPLSSLRRKIAANVTQSWTTIPHVHQYQDADITDLTELRKRYAHEFKKKGATLTLTSFFLKAVVHALKLYPQLNATLDLTNSEVIYKDYYNIGVAVDTPAGLIVPVVRDVDRKDLFRISVELADLAKRTRKREVTLEELRGATFTVSNMGGLGAGPFAPIIYPPQVGILGVGRAQVTPVYLDGQFVPRRMVQICVGYDHRLIDGADGARFTNEIANAMEDVQATFLGL